MQPRNWSGVLLGLVLQLSLVQPGGSQLPFNDGQF